MGLLDRFRGTKSKSKEKLNLKIVEVAREYNKRNSSCIKCGERISRSLTASHFREKHPEYKFVTTPQSKIKCGECAVAIADFESLVNHWHHNHLEELVNRGGTVSVSVIKRSPARNGCARCGLQIYKGETAKHYKENHPEYGFEQTPKSPRVKCSACGHSVSNFYTLIDHWEKAHGDLLAERRKDPIQRIKERCETILHQEGEENRTEAEPITRRKRVFCYKCDKYIYHHGVYEHILDEHPEYKFSLAFSGTNLSRRPICSFCGSRLGSSKQIIRHWDNAHPEELAENIKQIKQGEASEPEVDNTVKAALQVGARIIEEEERMSKTPKEKPAQFRHNKIKEIIETQLGDKPKTIHNVETVIEKTYVLLVEYYGSVHLKTWIYAVCDDLGLPRHKKRVESEQEVRSGNGARLDDIDRSITVVEQALRLQAMSIKASEDTVRSLQYSMKNMETAMKGLIVELGGKPDGST